MLWQAEVTEVVIAAGEAALTATIDADVAPAEQQVPITGRFSMNLRCYCMLCRAGPMCCLLQ